MTSFFQRLLYRVQQQLNGGQTLLAVDDDVRFEAACAG